MMDTRPIDVFDLREGGRKHLHGATGGDFVYETDDVTSGARAEWTGGQYDCYLHCGQRNWAGRSFRSPAMIFLSPSRFLNYSLPRNAAEDSHDLAVREEGIRHNTRRSRLGVRTHTAFSIVRWHRSFRGCSKPKGFDFFVTGWYHLLKKIAGTRACGVLHTVRGWSAHPSRFLNALPSGIRPVRASRSFRERNGRWQSLQVSRVWFRASFRGSKCPGPPVRCRPRWRRRSGRRLAREVRRAEVFLQGKPCGRPSRCSPFRGGRNASPNLN